METCLINNMCSLKYWHKKKGGKGKKEKKKKKKRTSWYKVDVIWKQGREVACGLDKIQWIQSKAQWIVSE